MPANLESEIKLKLQFVCFSLEFQCLFNICARLILTTYKVHVDGAYGQLSKCFSALLCLNTIGIY